MLGMIHRTNLGKGAEHFKEFFVPADESRNPDGRLAIHGHNRQLRSYRTGRYLDVVAHSLLGAIDVYNILPEYVVEANNVSEFQNRLQQMLKVGASERHLNWTTMLSNRHLTFRHPVLQFQGFTGFAKKEKVTIPDGTNVGSLATTNCVNGWLQFGAGAATNNE